MEPKINIGRKEKCVVLSDRGGHNDIQKETPCRDARQTVPKQQNTFSLSECSEQGWWWGFRGGVCVGVCVCARVPR